MGLKLFEGLAKKFFGEKGAGEPAGRALAEKKMSEEMAAPLARAREASAGVERAFSSMHEIAAQLRQSQPVSDKGIALTVALEMKANFLARIFPLFELPKKKESLEDLEAFSDAAGTAIHAIHKVNNDNRYLFSLYKPVMEKLAVRFREAVAAHQEIDRALEKPREVRKKWNGVLGKMDEEKALEEKARQAEGEEKKASEALEEAERALLKEKEKKAGEQREEQEKRLAHAREARIACEARISRPAVAIERLLRKHAHAGGEKERKRAEEFLSYPVEFVESAENRQWLSQIAGELKALAGSGKIEASEKILRALEELQGAEALLNQVEEARKEEEKAGAGLQALEALASEEKRLAKAVEEAAGKKRKASEKKAALEKELKELRKSG